jgi:hypothetical protein
MDELKKLREGKKEETTEEKPTENGLGMLLKPRVRALGKPKDQKAGPGIKRTMPKLVPTLQTKPENIENSEKTFEEEKLEMINSIKNSVIKLMDRIETTTTLNADITKLMDKINTQFEKSKEEVTNNIEQFVANIADQIIDGDTSNTKNKLDVGKICISASAQTTNVYNTDTQQENATSSHLNSTNYKLYQLLAHVTNDTALVLTN